MACGKLSSKTSIKFSLRFIFLVITLVGIVCALLAPVVRSWPPAKQTAFLLILAAMALTTLVIPFLFVFVQNYLERLAGEPIARFTGKWHTFIRAFYFLGGCFYYTLASLYLCLLGYMPWSIWSAEPVFSLLFSSCVLTALGIFCFCTFWWSGLVLEIRSKGIMLGIFFIQPWKSFKCFRWEGERLMLTRKRGTYLFIANRSFKPVIFSVHAADKPLIDQCLSKYLPTENNNESSG